MFTWARPTVPGVISENTTCVVCVPSVAETAASRFPGGDKGLPTPVEMAWSVSRLPVRYNTTTLPGEAGFEATFTLRF